MKVFLLIISLTVTALSLKPELGLAVGYSTTLSITAPDGGSPVIADQGVFYDLFSTSLSASGRFATFSFGAVAGRQSARELFFDSHETTFKSHNLGVKAVYNFEATDSADWLIPFKVSCLHHWMRLDFDGSSGPIKVDGEGDELVASIGLERAFKCGLSLGFSIGRGYIWSSFEDGPFGLNPKADFDGWRFEAFSRFSPRNRPR